MANLRERLKRIQDIKKPDNRKDSQEAVPENDAKELPGVIFRNWKPYGYNVLKREIEEKSPFNNRKLSSNILVFVPDLFGNDVPDYEDFIFFDLETTGLSGGAGTVAFLAAFGRVRENKLRITQYLLLDYSGENDFLVNVLSEFNNDKDIIVSYNGKSFDSQILKTRCLINRFNPPVYRHVDLLHPSRRLWKNIIQNCSQASVETKILGIDRSDDIPGSLAPDIWFDFLKTGNNERLLGICNHNKADIQGLASIFAAVISIAQNPLAAEYSFDLERIALFWRIFLKRKKVNLKYNDLHETAKELLHHAALKDFPRALYVYSYDLMRSGDYFKAVKYAKRGLELLDDDSVLYQKLIRRIERLEKKLKKS